MSRKKINKQDVAFWVYLALLIILALFGFWDSPAAESLIRALHNAFQLIIGQ